jgi:hypothetical protein
MEPQSRWTFTLLAALALILLFGNLAQLTAGPLVLNAGFSSSAGAAPHSVTGADFNGDGKLDTATANYSSNSVSVIYGDGTGHFGNPVPYAVGTKPWAIIAADLNNDGKPDLAVTNYETNNFSVLIDTGSGFSAAVSYPSGVGPNSIVARDLNGDGRLDIATSDYLAGVVAVSLASAGGGFDPPAIYGVNGGEITGIDAGDINGDGVVDLVVSDYTHGAVVSLVGIGNGTFMPFVSSPVGTVFSLSALALGDFNGDGLFDAATVSNGGSLYILLSSGGGAFNLATSSGTSWASGVNFLGVRDLNLDGKLDLYVTGYDTGVICVLYGNGAGGISSLAVSLVSYRPHGAVAGDLNADGRIDLAVASEGSGLLTTLLRRSDGSFPGATPISASGSFPRLADINGDGINDLIYGALFVSLGNGAGGFNSPASYPTGNGGMDILVGDVNNDGKLDVVTSGGNGGGIATRLNIGNGVLDSPINVSVQPGPLALADFDGDGKPDLAVGNPLSSASSNIKILHGDGQGHFLQIAAATVPPNVTWLGAADLNNDGRPDLVANSGISSPLQTSIVLATGPNTFGTATNLATGACAAGSRSLAIADFNHDGTLDLAAPGACGGGGGHVYLGHGNGVFGQPDAAISAGTNTGTAFAADFDHDGNMDVGFNGGGSVSIALGDGQGHFGAPTGVQCGGLSRTEVGDANNDGTPDLLCWDSGTPAWLVTNLSRLLRGLSTADFDGDGKTDLSVFRPSTGSWYILRSSDNSFYGVQFGMNGDRPVPGDYEGDGKTDIAVFRPSTGDWYYLRSSDGAFASQHQGAAGDIPVPGDYDGDGRTNFAVFRPSAGNWYTSTDPATNYGAVHWGDPTDIPTAADFDGDGRSDVAVFRPSSGTWYLLRSTAGFLQLQQGANGDRPVPQDFDGDFRANPAVFRPANGIWYRSTNTAANYNAIQWGQSGDALAPGYYDGDNKADVAVFRDGIWYIFYSSTNTYSFFNFGTAGDIPIPSAFVPQ